MYYNLEVLEEKNTDELYIPGLVKLLMYGNFVRARSMAESRTVKEIVEEELNLFPYSRKNYFLDPYFAPVDISYANLSFNPALTDAGICQGGDSIDILDGLNLHLNYCPI